MRRIACFALLLLFLAAGCGEVPTMLPGPILEAAPEPAAHIQVSSTWMIERADAPKIFSAIAQRSLALDTGGHPHVAYGEDRLYYAWYDGSQWRFETVDDTPGAGSHASLDMDSLDRPHISYYGGDGTLKYAYRTGATWQIATVDAAGWVGWYTSLALDAADHPHISYSPVSLGGLRYASFNGTTWYTTTVDNEGAYTSLALDQDGWPHIAYFGTEEWDLKYAAYDGSSWQTQTVDGGNVTGVYPSLALDSLGQPHISYNDYTNDDLEYAYLEGTVWHTETVDSAGQIGLYTSLALDPANRPLISYCANAWTANRDYCGALKYARHDGMEWQIATVEDNMLGEGTSLALGAAGQPYVAYLDGYPTFNLRMAHHNGSTWQLETVDQEERVGWYTSLALDAAGRPHISYCAFNEGFYTMGCDALKYASYDGSAWQITTVDSGTDVGRDSSLALDSADQPHVAYQGARYAYFDGATWVAATVPIGVGPSLALDSTGRPHISSYRVDAPYWNMLLLYAYYDGAAWITTTVDNRDACGGSLALDAADRPHIAYGELYLDQYMHLKYAYDNGVGWITTTVDGTDGAGWSPSLALDGAGQPHIAYVDQANHLLRYAYYVTQGVEEGFWQLSTVDTASHNASGSLALDTAGRPHIAYDDGYDTLKYAYYDGTAWQIQPVDDGEVGAYASLALDAHDQPHISYYDDRNKDLKYAWLCTLAMAAKITGPHTLLAGQEGTYRAEPLPITASLPLAFAWSDGTTAPGVTFSWPEVGTYTITVTATNPCGEGRGTLAVQVIERWPFRMYLPLVVREQ